MTSSNLEADFISNGERDIALDIILTVRQKETFTTIFIANSALLTGAKLSCYHPCHSFFTQNLKKNQNMTIERNLDVDLKNGIVKETYHFRCDFGNRTGDGFSVAAVIGHFKFNRVSNLQVFNVTVKLTKMKKEAGLAFTALDKSIGMLH